MLDQFVYFLVAFCQSFLLNNNRILSEMRIEELMNVHAYNKKLATNTEPYLIYFTRDL